MLILKDGDKISAKLQFLQKQMGLDKGINSLKEPGDGNAAGAGKKPSSKGFVPPGEAGPASIRVSITLMEAYVAVAEKEF